MLAFGLIVLGVAARLGRHGRMSRRPLLVIGLAYLAFGLAAFLMTGLNPHFVLFMATGVLVLIPAFGPGSPA